jgi:hypothetical protein
MGLSFIKSIITSIIGSLVAKIIMYLIIFLLAHSGFIFTKDYINGKDTTFGTALGQAVKSDVKFVKDNSSLIFETISDNFNDFKKEL